VKYVHFKAFLTTGGLAKYIDQISVCDTRLYGIDLFEIFSLFEVSYNMIHEVFRGNVVEQKTERVSGTRMITFSIRMSQKPHL